MTSETCLHHSVQQVYKFKIKRKRKKKKTISIRIDNCTKLRFMVYPQCSGNKGYLYRKKRRDKQALKECNKKLFRLLNKKERRDKRKGSRSDYEAKKEVAATIEDKDEEDKEIMEVLGAEEVDTQLDYEVDSEMTIIRECSQKMYLRVIFF